MRIEEGYTMKGTLLVLGVVVCAVILNTSVFGQSAVAAEPIRLHPDNPHYFLFRNKPTVFVSSAEHYGAVMNLDFDYVPYFQELGAYGLNQTRTFSGTYVEYPGWFGYVNNTMVVEENRFICPWARSSTPGYANGGNKFDLRSSIRRISRVSRTLSQKRANTVWSWNMCCSVPSIMMHSGTSAP